MNEIAIDSVDTEVAFQLCIHSFFSRFLFPKMTEQIINEHHFGDHNSCLIITFSISLDLTNF